MVKQKTFTMIEIILALIIIAIAIVAITGIFPISMRMHNNAMRQNQAVDVSQELMNWAAYRVRKANELTPPDGLPEVFGLSETDIKNLLKNASLDPNIEGSTDREWIISNPMDESSSGEAGIKYFFYDDPGTQTSGTTLDDGIVRAIRRHDAYRGGKKVQVTELDIVVAIWRSEDSKTPNVYYDEVEKKLIFGRRTLEQANFNEYGQVNMDVIRLNLEASWPGSAKYEDREKLRMVMEVNRQK